MAEFCSARSNTISPPQWTSLSPPFTPKLVKTIDVGDGAHHVGLTKDGRYGVVQSSFLNLPGMSSGTISVIDLKTEELVGTITSLSDAGYNPNVIVLLPEWNIFGGH